ncbi:MAG TPA: hypothetical protein VJ622_15330 [Acidimicrobiia bacterium]|nr:hypothetical protein [Acidimicrobiia bacterium]HTC82676.1 hypothetical protein [Acidimicrobiia bacterium]
MKRPILVLLAAALLNIGVVGTAPARAAGPDSVTTAVATPDHHHHHHRHHHRGDDGDEHEGRHRCHGLIVVCLL